MIVNAGYDVCMTRCLNMMGVVTVEFLVQISAGGIG